ncbi:MAG: hypothetical protein EBT86_00505 [Actinobacteria bacterium]|nr:hypothetical protein [Actinomycetota bacterium]
MKGLEQAFDQLFDDTLNRQGWLVPKSLKRAMVSILVEKLDKNPWQPEPSYAQLYLTARRPETLKWLGDTCWFTRAIFPQLGTRRGISASYYTDLGQGCYSRLLNYIGPDNNLELMIRHFDFLAEVAWTVVHSQGQFRKMWSED